MAIETIATNFATAVGEVLREIRTGRGLSLRQVTVRSRGAFKPSSVASYERGERQISVERLFHLADVYEVAPERVVAAIAHRLERSRGDRGQDDEDVTIVLDQFALGSRQMPRR
ncbi:MAG: helix-turn-helix domain-containing protein [Actinomycetota bacterium]